MKSEILFYKPFNKRFCGVFQCKNKVFSGYFKRCNGQKVLPFQVVKNLCLDTGFCY
jgi:hypothetical protein